MDRKFLSALLLLAPSPLSLVAPVAAQADEFSFTCFPLTIQLSDPIISPGVPSAHTHVIVGGTAFQRTMDADTAKNARETTCAVEIDKSNYWVPQLYHIMKDGAYEMIEYEWSAIYYLNRACDYAEGKQYCDKTSYPLAPPAGLRMVAGNPYRRTYDDFDFSNRASSHMCLRADGSSHETKELPEEPCQRLRSQVFMPSCWDGKNLDSEDHQSHMAYPAIGDYNGGVCPESHPVAIISIFMEFIFNTEPFPDHENWIYAMGDKVGYGFHGDFVNGWTDQDALQDALATCTLGERLNNPNCSITKNQQRPVAAITVDPEVPAPGEELGQNGPIRKLPGHPDNNT